MPVSEADHMSTSFTTKPHIAPNDNVDEARRAKGPSLPAAVPGIKTAGTRAARNVRGNIERVKQVSTLGGFYITVGGKRIFVRASKVKFRAGAYRVNTAALQHPKPKRLKKNIKHLFTKHPNPK